MLANWRANTTSQTDGRRVPPFRIRESFVEMVRKFENDQN